MARKMIRSSIQVLLVLVAEPSMLLGLAGLLPQRRPLERPVQRTGGLLAAAAAAASDAADFTSQLIPWLLFLFRNLAAVVPNYRCARSLVSFLCGALAHAANRTAAEAEPPAPRSLLHVLFLLLLVALCPTTPANSLLFASYSSV